MDDSTLIAVLWIGSRSISGYSRGEHLARRVSRTDELQLRALLDPTTVIGVISNQRPDAPQN